MYAFPYQTLTEVEVSWVAVVFVMNWAHCINRFVFRLVLLCLSGVGTWQWTFNPWLVCVCVCVCVSVCVSRDLTVDIQPMASLDSWSNLPFTHNFIFLAETKNSSQRSRGHHWWRVVQQSEFVVRMQDCVSYSVPLQIYRLKLTIVFGLSKIVKWSLST